MLRIPVFPHNIVFLSCVTLTPSDCMCEDLFSSWSVELLFLLLVVEWLFFRDSSPLLDLAMEVK